MSIRHLPSIIAVAAALASPLAFADRDGFRPSTAEAGSEYVGDRGTPSRDQGVARRDAGPRVSERSANLPEGAPRAGFTSSREQVRQPIRQRDQGFDFGTESGWMYQDR